MNESDPHETRAQPVLACLGVASRFRLVMALAGADRCVGDLAVAVGLSQSCTTRHLQALERVGLVKGKREGRRVRFRLRAEAPEFEELLGWVLSGAGVEALVAGGDLVRHQTTARPARSVARLSPPVGVRRGRTPVRRRRPEEAASSPETAPEPKGTPGTRDSTSMDASEASGSVPARRPGDLEDYLL